MKLDEILLPVAEDAKRHICGPPATEAEIEALESRLSLSLPEDYSQFLRRSGAGIYYERHEIFGPRRVMIHDIELVPDLVTMRQRLESEGWSPVPGLYPLHRAEGIVHLIDLGSGETRGRVVRASDGESYVDFPSFFAAVVLP